MLIASLGTHGTSQLAEALPKETAVTAHTSTDLRSIPLCTLGIKAPLSPPSYLKYLFHKVNPSVHMLRIGMYADDNVFLTCDHDWDTVSYRLCSPYSLYTVCEEWPQ